MQKVQDALAECNQWLALESYEIEILVWPDWMYYELLIFSAQYGFGVASRVLEDYTAGIGWFCDVNWTPGLEKVMSDLQVALSDLQREVEKRIASIRMVSQACHDHVIKAGLPEGKIAKNPIFLIRVRANEAVFQVLFQLKGNVWIPGYEDDAARIFERWFTEQKKPFSQIPLYAKRRELVGDLQNTLEKIL